MPSNVAGHMLGDLVEADDDRCRRRRCGRSPSAIERAQQIEVSVGRGPVDEFGEPLTAGSIAQRTVEAAARDAYRRLPSPHVSRRVRRDATRQAGAHHGRLRLHPDVRRARRRGQPAEPPAARRRGAARRPRRHLHGEPRPLLRGRLGLPLRRRGVHRVLEPADERRAGVHPQRLRGQGVHHLEVQGRPGRRDRRRHARRRRCG